MKIRYLTLLTALIFLGFTFSAYAIKPGNDYPKYGWEWIWNGTQVGSTYAQGRTFPLEMTYISPLVGNYPGSDNECFGDDVTFGGFFRKKAGKAVGMFWFPGFTKYSAGNQKKVLYLLKIEGTFVAGSDGFPGNGKVMHMTHWTLSVENQGKRVKSRSCVGSGTFGSGTGNDFVMVTFTPAS